MPGLFGTTSLSTRTVSLNHDTSNTFALTSITGSAGSASRGNIGNDVELKDLPDDSISDLSFCPNNDILSVSSWDQKVRIYQVESSGLSQGKALYEHQAPVLCTTWSRDGQLVFSGGADKAARMLDISSNSNIAQQVAAHDQPIRCVGSFQFNGNNTLATGSWDKTIRYWDLRSSTPMGELKCPERVYAMDVKDNLMVIATADRFVHVVNLADPLNIYKTIQSPLKWQTRAVSCFPNCMGYAIGSVEGRCAIQYIEEKHKTLNFTFKCHRVTNNEVTPNVVNVYAVNCITFHPKFGTFATGGSDGTFHFWDKDAKQRVREFPNVGGSITALEFNRTGTILAYAISYDWSKGYAYRTPNYPNKVMLHVMGPDEGKAKDPKKK